MGYTIRPMRANDKPHVLAMMRVFYASPAVYTNGSEEIFATDIDTCLSDSPYLEGYVVEGAEGLQGYAMVAKSFSTEFGKECIWIEDLYIQPPYRGQGIGRVVIDHIAAKYPGSILRLEVEAENEHAVHVYRKCGFTELPYLEMKK